MKTENFPIISIITPSYNQGKYIEQTILSVVSQEGRFYLDYIVVDGGSVDDSVNVIKKYEQIFIENRFPVKCNGIDYRWISESDGGQSEALNKGFMMAKGDVITWLNSDDTYLGGTISKVIKEFLSHPNASLIYGDCNIVDRENNLIKKWETGPFSKNTLSRYCPLAQPAVFFRSKILKEVGLLNQSLHFAMDYEYWVRIYKGKYRVNKINATLANCRLHSECKTFSPYNSIGELLCVVFQYFTDVFPETLRTYILQLCNETKCDIETARDYFYSEIKKYKKEALEPIFSKSISYGYILAKLEYIVIDIIKYRKGNISDLVKIIIELPLLSMRNRVVVLLLKALFTRSCGFVKNRLSRAKIIENNQQ
ncbi:MAG: glycosyltransferase family 2 protein [Ignavibacteria bacterium]|nr:glycosyltransferase family 2 protein [Ignavibacteria bacterium]